MRCSRSDRVKGWRGAAKKSREKHISYFIFLPVPIYFRALLTGGRLIGDEPWRRQHSQHLATTYRLWRRNPFPSHLYLYITPLWLPLFPHRSLPVFIGNLWFSRGSVEVMAAESSRVFYTSWSVTRPTYSIPPLLVLTYQRWLTNLNWSLALCCLFAAASPHTLPNISLSQLQSMAVLGYYCSRWVDRYARVLLSICRCYLLWIDW